MTAALPAGGGDSGFVVSLERYSGPLDLLLALIRREEIDIYDIPIARIADQFHQVITQLGLDEASEYLELAARLLRIKAAMLLPRRGEGQSLWCAPYSRYCSLCWSYRYRCQGQYQASSGRWRWQ